MKIKYVFLTLSVVALMAACSKKPTPTTSMEDMLRTGKWHVTSGTLKVKLPGGADTSLNYYSFVLPTCLQDNYIVFDSQYHAQVFSGTNLCTPGDPDHEDFLWKLDNNNTTMSLYNGFNNLYSIADTILPFSFDTVSQSPYLVLDTIHGYNDTLLGYTRTVVVLDTMWKVIITPTPDKYYDINNAALSNFSQSSFTLTFDRIGNYYDTTGFHEGLPYAAPVLRQDTFHYSITFGNF